MSIPILTDDLQITSRRYCTSLTHYSRYPTREVHVGNVPLGGNNPIRVQSMTTTDTQNTKATVDQSIRIIKAGADYVRITAPSQTDAHNLKIIKKELQARGYNTPLIADIHYTPNAAEIAARIVEKVRINPGNYADRKRFQIIEYDEHNYALEIERIREKFLPLIKICKENGTSMRIGTNHGSLSDRIMSRFGDTPLGMVESALEFARICEDWNYHDIVFSMKASNPQIMVQAYRLLIHKMEAEGMAYPLHLGVTEAGDGEDGRIKSAVGIGALLEDGIGDTIRVSLTEEPEAEVPVAISLIERYNLRSNHDPIPKITSNPINPFSYTRRNTQEVDIIGGKNPPSIIIGAQTQIFKSEALIEIGYSYNPTLDKWHIADQAADFLYLGKTDLTFSIPQTLKKIFDFDFWLSQGKPPDAFPLFTVDQYRKAVNRSTKINFILVELNDLTNQTFHEISQDTRSILVLQTTNTHAMPELRRAMIRLIENDLKTPVILKQTYSSLKGEDLVLFSATDLGTPLVDGLGDGIWIEAPCVSIEKINQTGFGILQATRTRISKTEYISCPSCGRTLFDLQETTNHIQKQTSHLKGIKIGIMGCIVNGPGEMADADYGYVGSGPEKISLYKGKNIVKRNISTKLAVEELINLIREDGRWVDP